MSYFENFLKATAYVELLYGDLHLPIKTENASSHCDCMDSRSRGTSTGLGLGMPIFYGMQEGA